MTQSKLSRIAQLCLRAGLLAALAATPAHALPGDRSQPLSTDADKLELDDKSGTTTLYGNVIIEQGSMRITADKVILHYNKNKLTHVIATGEPAHYSQVPRPNQEPVQARAKRLEYHIEQETLTLLNNASLVQDGGTSLSGNRIDYDVKKSLVKAGSDIEEGEKRRVRLVIPAKTLSNQE